MRSIQVRNPWAIRFLVAESNRWIESRPGAATLLTTFLVVYLLAYLGHPSLPGNNLAFPLGWWGWWDQSQYLKEATALAHGRITAQSYWYPLGYPFFGAVFHGLAPNHAFLLPNLGFSLGITVTYFYIARRLLSATETVLLIVGFIFCFRELMSGSLIVPWNTIPTHLFCYALILLAVGRFVTLRTVLAAAILSSLIYICRPADVVYAIPLVGMLVLQIPSWKHRLWGSLVAGLALILTAGSIAVINHYVFGSWKTPYEEVVGKIGFGSYPFGEKIFLLFVDGCPFFREPDSALLSHFPWLLLVPAGAILLFFHRSLLAAGVLFSITLCYVLCGSYNDFWPSNVFKFGLIHYLTWTVPLLALIAYAGIRKLRQSKGAAWCFVTTGLLLLPLWFVVVDESESGKLGALSQATEVRATAGHPIDWIAFEGRSTPPRLQQRFADLRERYDYITAQRPNGVAVLLSSRARVQSVRIVVQEGSISSVEFGRIKWRMSWLRPLLALQSYVIRPEITLFGRGKGLDLGGPQGDADSVPDEVVEIRMLKTLLSKIATWNLESEDHSTHWVNFLNPQHWWLIKELHVTQNPSALRGTIWLSFPDFGQLQSGQAFILSARDRVGHVLLRATIQGNRVRIGH